MSILRETIFTFLEGKVPLEVVDEIEAALRDPEFEMDFQLDASAHPHVLELGQEMTLAELKAYFEQSGLTDKGFLEWLLEKKLSQ
jgi:hypothetical protein